MTRAPLEPAPPTTHTRRWSVRRRSVVMASVATTALLLGACGGDDDDADDSSTTTTIVAAATPTTVVRTTVAPSTLPPTTTLPAVEYVTDGATVIVANASGINGAAGRLSDRLAVVGYTVGDATNSSDSVGQLSTTQVYYDPDSDGAQAVAASLQAALGGGDIELLELGLPAPTDSGEMGDATVLVMMGNDVADKSLDELQGRVAPATTDDTATDDTATDDTTPDTTDG